MDSLHTRGTKGGSARLSVLTICPTMGRPVRAYQMARSFHATKRGDTDLIFYVDSSDPHLGGYFDKLPEEEIRIVDGLTTTQIYNKAILDFQNYDAYHMTNDDFIYHTEGWDVMMTDLLKAKGPGLVYGNDLVQRQNLCTAPMVSAQIVRALGWLQLPTLTHLCGDLVWMEIGRRTKRIWYLPDVEIEHRHYHQHKELMDETYKITNDPKMYDRDRTAFKAYVNGDIKEDICRIGDVLSAVS